MTNSIDNLQTALAAGASSAPSHDAPDGGKIIIIPHGYRAERVAPLEPPLTRIHQSVTLHDRDSFIAYVNRYKSEATRIFAEPGFLAGGPARVVAVLDYHVPGKPDYAAHVATYSPRYSDQWTRWHKACAQALKQGEFAEFDSVVYQPNGDVKLAYDERTEQKGSSGSLPEQMKLGIPVYFRGSAYAVPVLVRYRVGNGAVAFSLKIDRADIIEDTAFSELTKAISEATSIDCYLGRR